MFLYQSIVTNILQPKLNSSALASRSCIPLTTVRVWEILHPPPDQTVYQMTKLPVQDRWWWCVDLASVLIFQHNVRILSQQLTHSTNIVLNYFFNKFCLFWKLYIIWWPEDWSNYFKIKNRQSLIVLQTPIFSFIGSSQVWKYCHSKCFHI